MFIPNSIQTAQGNWTASCLFTGHLAASLRSRAEFRSGDHAQLLTYGRAEIQRWKSHEAGDTLAAVVGDLYPVDSCHIHRGQNKFACLSVAPNTVNWMDIGAQESRYAVFLQYGIEPP